MSDTKRIATLVAFTNLLEYTATDDVIDLLDLLVKGLLSKSKREGEKQRLRTLKDLDAAALKLTEVVEVLIDPECKDINVRIEAFTRVSHEQLTIAVAKVCKNIYVRSERSEAISNPCDCIPCASQEFA